MNETDPLKLWLSTVMTNVMVQRNGSTHKVLRMWTLPLVESVGLVHSENRMMEKTNLLVMIWTTNVLIE